MKICIKQFLSEFRFFCHNYIPKALPPCHDASFTTYQYIGMKSILKTFVALFAAYPLCAIGQKVGKVNLANYYGFDSVKIYAQIDSLIYELNKGYVLNVIQPWSSAMTAYFSDRIYNNDSLKIKVHIYMNKTKGNPALDIDGKPFYALSSITGKYIDIFPIWKKINPIAKLETATQKEAEKHIDGWKILGENGVGSWIEIKPPMFAQKRNIYSIDFVWLNWIDYKMREAPKK